MRPQRRPWPGRWRPRPQPRRLRTAWRRTGLPPCGSAASGPPNDPRAVVRSRTSQANAVALGWPRCATSIALSAIHRQCSPASSPTRPARQTSPSQPPPDAPTVLTSGGEDANTGDIDNLGLYFLSSGHQSNINTSSGNFLLVENSVTWVMGNPITLEATNAPCYCPGTLILTDRGNVPVGALAINDTVITASGGARPIRWIGRRSYDGRFLASAMHPMRGSGGFRPESAWRAPRRDHAITPISRPARLEYVQPRQRGQEVMKSEGATSGSSVAAWPVAKRLLSRSRRLRRHGAAKIRSSTKS